MHKPNDRCTNFEVRAKGDGILEMINLNCDICSIDKLTCGVYAAYNKAKTYSVSFEFDKEKRMKITIYTKKGEQHSYENVEKYDIRDVGPGLLTFRHDEQYIEYYRLGTVDRWTIEEENK